VIAAAIQAVVAVALGWSALQTIVAVVFAFDIGGGVAVNSTKSGAAWWHRPALSTRVQVAFYLIHLHPFVIAWLWPSYSFIAAGGVYAFMLISTLLVSLTPQHLQRPLGLTLASGGIVLGLTVLTMPPGLSWLPALYFLKLIAGHAVHPQPKGTDKNGSHSSM
jgi:hypothetical protein